MVMTRRRVVKTIGIATARPIIIARNAVQRIAALGVLGPGDGHRCPRGHRRQQRDGDADGRRETGYGRPSAGSRVRPAPRATIMILNRNAPAPAGSPGSARGWRRRPCPDERDHEPVDRAVADSDEEGHERDDHDQADGGRGAEDRQDRPEHRERRVHRPAAANAGSRGARLPDWAVMPGWRRGARR